MNASSPFQNPPGPLAFTTTPSQRPHLHPSPHPWLQSVALSLAALTVLPLSTPAQTLPSPPLIQSLDLDGDRSLDLAVSWNGQLWIQFQAGSPNAVWTRIPLTDHAWPHTDRLHAADLNHDNHDDLVLSSPGANRVLVVFGPPNASTAPQIRSIPLPGGPTDSDAAPHPTGVPGPSVSALGLDTPTPFLALISRPTLNPPNDPLALETVRFPWVIDADPHPLSLGLATLPQTDRVHWHAWLHQPHGPATNPSPAHLTWFQHTNQATASFRKISNITLKRGVLGAVPTWIPGAIHPTPAVVAWGPGLTEILVVHPPPGPDLPSVINEIPLTYSSISWQPIAGNAFDGRFLVARDLQRELAVYRWTPDAQLQQVDAVSPPNGRDFIGTAAWTDAGLATPLLPTASAHSSNTPPSIGFYQNTEDGLVFHSESSLPDPRLRPLLARVLVYDRNPFADSQAQELARLTAGDWTREAEVLDGGVTALTATFRNSPSGLSGGTSRALVVPTPLPTSAFALPNQWEPASSLHFLSPPALPSSAAVLPQPAPGSHPQPLHLTFLTDRSVTVFSRFNEGPWQSGPGPFPISQTTLVTYYGVDAEGFAGPRQSALYTLGAPTLAPSQPVLADTDNDSLDDSWERRFFGDLAGLPWADDDGDGFSNLEEHEAGTHPGDPASRPDGDPQPQDPPTLQWTTTNDGGLRLSWNGPASAQFTVQTSDTLLQWLPSTTAPTYQDGAHHWTDPSPPDTARFYRILFQR